MLQVLEGDMVIRGYTFESGDFADDRFMHVVAPFALEPPTQIVCYKKDADFSTKHVLQNRLKKVCIFICDSATTTFTLS